MSKTQLAAGRELVQGESCREALGLGCGHLVSNRHQLHFLEDTCHRVTWKEHKSLARRTGCPDVTGQMSQGSWGTKEKRRGGPSSFEPSL